MMGFGLASEAVRAAADFEEAVLAVSRVIGVEPDKLRSQAVDISAVSMVSPVEALRQIADALPEETP